MMAGSFYHQTDAVTVQYEIQNGAFMDEREVIPFAGSQVLAKVDAFGSVTEVYFDVQRAVGQ